MVEYFRYLPKSNRLAMLLPQNFLGSSLLPLQPNRCNGCALGRRI